MTPRKTIIGIIIAAFLVFVWPGSGVFIFLAKAFSLLVCLILALVALRRMTLTAGALLLSPFPDPALPDPLPSITVFVPAHNEESVIGQCIEALARVDYPENKMNIVVIDDASDDATAQIVRRFARVHLLQRTPEVGGRGKPAALNAALERFPDQDLCFFLDADSVVAPDAPSRAAAHLSRRDVGAVAGRLDPCNPNDSAVSFYTAVESWTHQLATLSPASRMGLTSAVLGSNWAIRRPVLDAYGFSERALLEDTDISVALQTDGMRIVFDEGMVASHEAPVTVGEYFRQHVGWARGFTGIGRKRTPRILTGEGSPVRKLDRLIYSWGYFDRPLMLILPAMAFANLWQPVFFAPAWLVAAVFLMPVVQMVAGMIRAKRPWKDFLSLYRIPIIFVVDIAAALTAFWMDLQARPVRWYKTARRKDLSPGVYLNDPGGGHE